MTVPAAPAAFDLRERCIACGSGGLRTLWEGRYSDAVVAGWLRECFYSGHPERALGDEAFRFVECGGCGQRFHSRILSAPWLAVLYEQWADAAQVEAFERSFAAGRGWSDARFLKAAESVRHLLRVRRVLGRPAEATRLLDFGCGAGEFLALAAAFGFDAIGVDLSAGRRTQAAVSGATILPSIDAVVAMPGFTPFDAVILIEVLEHLPDPLAVLHALHGVMAPGGVLVVETPDARGVDVPVDIHGFRRINPLEHINAFTPASLEAIVRRAGFRRIARGPAHVTADLPDVLRASAGALLRRARTSQYFRKPG